MKIVEMIEVDGIGWIVRLENDWVMRFEATYWDFRGVCAYLLHGGYYLEPKTINTLCN
jgi:hypothetical protein